MLKGGRILLPLGLVLAMCLLLPFTSCQSRQSVESDLVFTSLAPALANGRPTIAEFGRGTCIPCKEMKPLLENLAAEYKGRANVVIISVDDYRELTRQYGIMAIPTQIFIGRDGKEVSRHVGSFPKPDIVTELSKIGVE
jgi:thioredoxin 1